MANERRIQKISERFIPWDTIGTVNAGWVGSAEEITVGEDQGTTKRRTMRTDEGEIIAFLSPMSLERSLSHVGVGEWCQIEYVADQQTRNGVMKIFEVYKEVIEGTEDIHVDVDGAKANV